MNLLIDSGATKAEWCLLEGSSVAVRFTTRGINFSLISGDDLRSLFAEASEKIPSDRLSEVHLYAAGLIEGSDAEENAHSLLSGAFPGAVIECSSDMLAAARAVCGHEAGICAILGTGSNSCLYDGNGIVSRVRSGGFILGDEGSAACLGKMFISDFIKGLVPEPLSSEFASEFDVDYMTVVRRVYREASPSAYLGSFAPWILARATSSDYADRLVHGNLRFFFERSLLRHGRGDLPAGFVGGFAAACEDQIRGIAADCGIAVSSILPSPMEGLIEYHLV